MHTCTHAVPLALSASPEFAACASRASRSCRGSRFPLAFPAHSCTAVHVKIMDVTPKVHAEAAAPAEEKKPACKPCCRGKKLKKPSELSVYDCASDNIEYELVEEPPGQVENAVHYVRTSLSPYYNAIESASERVGDIYTTAVEHSKSSYEYVTREENTVARAMAISLGGLTGIILGARGGVFKKLIYGTVGATAAAAACYPKEAKQFSQDYLAVARDEVTAAVKQATGHDLKDLFSKVQLPKLPDFSPKTIDQVGQQKTS